MRPAGFRAASCLLLAGPLGFALACAGGTGAEDAGIVCDPGEGRMCQCPDGQLSVSWCRHDGADYLPCECEAGDEGFADENGGDGDGDGEGDGDPGDGDPGDGDGDGEPGDGDGEP
ncbi:MAG TPA: hypothetical protein VK034_04575, partial [Enhygromyxa sp.]|nr:hypothetical protein [Enhygromyxa sp.]